MKKLYLSLVILFIILLIGFTFNKSDTVKNGTYIMVQDKADPVVLPYIIIADKKFTFTYDLLSSYNAAGNYSTENGKLTMKTDDNQYTYVFLIDGNNLLFQEKESSPIKMKNDKSGIKIENNTKFHRKR